VEHVPWARDLARRLLADSLPRRWAHTQEVARKAESIGHIVGEDAELLVCAAWLHDIGYAPGLTKTGFHPLDGARYLRDVETTHEMLCRLVAHHSCALIEGRYRGMANELTREFPVITGRLPDALLYCDMTTSPDGETVDVATRLNEILARYGPGHVVANSIKEAQTQIAHKVRAIDSFL
jgi:putative nucleotidyltransferase with HDIG domain